MEIRHLSSKKAFILLLVLVAFLNFSPARGEQDISGTEINWQSFETRYTSIHYQTEADLLRFHQKIRFRGEHWWPGHLFSRPNLDELRKQITEKVDPLFERVQEILDMRRKMDKVVILVYPDKRQMREAYEKIYHAECRIRAWYQYRNNTVSVTVVDLHEGMLAHELAHAIIDHYLVVRPPAASAEILARYVDSHLKE